MKYAKEVSERVKFNFWDLISLTSPLPWKQLALILLLGGWGHLSKSQVHPRFVILQYLAVHAGCTIEAFNAAGTKRMLMNPDGLFFPTLCGLRHK